MSIVSETNAGAQTSKRNASSKSNDTVVLAPYQRRAVEILAAEIAKTQREIAYSDDRRRGEIGRKHGASLLSAPTGSGKTLILGRVIESLTLEASAIAAGFKGTVWLWFAPYAGLVEQTRLALKRDCTGIRPRDVMADREPSITRPGDVFVTTWSSVAASNREARRLRRTGERGLSLDDMIAELREQGWFIGCVIDEAHVNFGTNAKRAAEFYLEHLQPDVTILATATPKHKDLAAFMKSAGLGTPNRIEVARDDVVRAGLNKYGLVAATLDLTPEQRLAIDSEATILRAAWIHHNAVKDRLRERGIKLTPLMMVQVENTKNKGEDTVEQALDTLRRVGVPDAVIRKHTSGSPDPAFHSLAFDEDCEVLVFKVAAATGFDAPRAWTLASLRPSLSPEFGLQVVGRIMRVHKLVRPIHGQDDLLDRGRVFVADPKRQAGLEAAADILKALRSSIETVSDHVATFAFGDTDVKPLTGAGSVRAPISTPKQVEESVDERSMDLGEQLAEQVTRESEKQALEQKSSKFDFDMFGDHVAPAKKTDGNEAAPGNRFFNIKRDLGVPVQLRTERLPEPGELRDLAEAAAREFKIDDTVVALLMQEGVDAELKLTELLMSRHERRERVTALLSPARLARAAQGAFDFNENIDPRPFRSCLVQRFKEQLEIKGSYQTDLSRLGRVIDQIAVYEPDRIKSAIRSAQSRFTRVGDTGPLPEQIEDREGVFSAKRSVYGMFPSDLNKPERAFAEFIDDSAAVRWWLRNPSHPRCPWAVRIILANGKGFHPDFIIAVEGRRALDEIRLVEVKDDGSEGPLNSDLNVLKAASSHREYLDVLWVTKSNNESRIERLVYSEEKHKIVTHGRLSEEDLRGM